MLNLTKTCKYALKGIFYLVENQNSHFIKIKEISEKEAIPLNYLTKIFQHLTKRNILISNLGPLGGVRLNPGYKKLNVADLIELIDGKPNFDECTLLGYKKCPQLKNCPIKIECKKMTKSIWSKLKRFTLGSLN